LTDQKPPTIQRPLMDPFTEDATRRLREALDVARVSGNYTEVNRISNHLAAESGVSADKVLAIGLFRLSVKAGEAGDEGEAALLRTLIPELCSRDAVITAVVGGFMAAGFAEGWLPAPAYDEMIGHLYPSGVIDTSTETGRAVARIERREIQP